MVMRDGVTAPTSPIDIQREFPGTNSARLLRMLYRNGNRSRADLARAVGLTKATVSTLVADMIEAGLVVEVQQRTMSGPGRPAVELDLDRTGWQVVALDLSRDTEFRGAVLDLTGAVVARESVQRDGDTGDAALAKTKSLIDSLLARATRRVLGIGICAPGIVDPAGVVVSSHNLGWWGLPLRREVLAHTGLPTEVENDANAAALAELDTVDDLDDLLLVKVGFGVGGAIIANGRLIHGPSFTAGEIGHVSIDGTGPQCVCGRFGCLEATLAQPRLEATLRSVEGAAAREGVLEDAGRRLGVALAPLVGAFGMSSVVVSGPPEVLEGTLLQATREAMRPALAPELFDGLELRMTSLGDDVALQGALILVLGSVLDIA